MEASFGNRPVFSVQKYIGVRPKKLFAGPRILPEASFGKRDRVLERQTKKTGMVQDTN